MDKTAMQILFESLHNTHPENWNDLLLHDKEMLLEKERKQIEEAYSKGYLEKKESSKELTTCVCEIPKPIDQDSRICKDCNGKILE